MDHRHNWPGRDKKSYRIALGSDLVTVGESFCQWANNQLIVLQRSKPFLEPIPLGVAFINQIACIPTIRGAHFGQRFGDCPPPELSVLLSTQDGETIPRLDGADPGMNTGTQRSQMSLLHEFNIGHRCNSSY